MTHERIVRAMAFEHGYQEDRCKQLLEMLKQLIAIADKGIPSDNLSNRDLAEAEEVIAAAHALIAKMEN